MEAYLFITELEQIIWRETGLKVANKHGESWAEKIIYSEEYSSLNCSFWRAIAVCGDVETGSSAFEDELRRWDVGYTREDYRDRLISAFNEGWRDGFRSAFGDILDNEVFPTVEQKVRNGEI